MNIISSIEVRHVIYVDALICFMWILYIYNKCVRREFSSREDNKRANQTNIHAHGDGVYSWKWRIAGRCIDGWI